MQGLQVSQQTDRQMDMLDLLVLESLTHFLLLFRYKCHKNCAKLAPPSCGLSRELIKYFKRHLLLGHSPAPSLENMIQQVQYNQHHKQQTHYQTRGRGGGLVMTSSSAQNSPQTPPAMLSQPRGDGELIEDDESHFVIPNLSREPFNSEHNSSQIL